MSNEIAIPASTNNALVASNVTDDAFRELAKSSRFLPRLTLTAGTSGAVQEGKIGVGRYALILPSKEVEDLGVEFRAWILGLRLKAMDVGKEPIVSYYDSRLPAFKEIQARALVEKTGPLAGAEYLLYLSGSNKFCTLFMCSKTMRQEAPNVRLLLNSAATFKVTLIQNKKHKWHGPVVSKCSIAIDPPPKEDAARLLHEFLNPPASEVEAVTKEEKAAATAQEV